MIFYQLLPNINVKKVSDLSEEGLQSYTSQLSQAGKQFGVSVNISGRSDYEGKLALRTVQNPITPKVYLATILYEI